MYYCASFFIKKQKAILESTLKKQINIRLWWQQHEMDHYKKLLHVIKMLLTKGKTFLLVCAYEVEEYIRIITHANIFVNLHTYIPQKNKVSFYSFCCYRERSSKRRKEIVEKFDHCPVIVIGHLTLFSFYLFLSFWEYKVIIDLMYFMALTLKTNQRTRIYFSYTKMIFLSWQQWVQKRFYIIRS